MLAGRKAIILAVLAFGGAALWLTLAREESPAGFLPYLDARVVAQGARIYEAHCAACHGENLEGEADWEIRRPDGRLPAPPHDETGHTWHHPDAQLFFMTKYGVAPLVGEGYQSDMPAYEGVLDDAEIIAVLAFIKSRWPEEIRHWHNDLNRLTDSGG